MDSNHRGVKNVPLRLSIKEYEELKAGKPTDQSWESYVLEMAQKLKERRVKA